MSLADDTNDIIATTLWGETVSIYRNTETYGATGAPSDSWASVATPIADIQPMGGSSTPSALGTKEGSTHTIFVPSGTNVLVGDRVRPSGWSTGDDEYIVDNVMTEEDKIILEAHIVEGHA